MKYFIMSLCAVAVICLASSCKEEKRVGDKIGDGINQAVDKTSDAASDAKDAANKALEGLKK